MLPLVQVRHAKWTSLNKLPHPPKNARGMCPIPGLAYQYSVAVWHFARAMYFAAKGDAHVSHGADPEWVDNYYSMSNTDAWRLQVSRALLCHCPMARLQCRLLSFVAAGFCCSCRAWQTADMAPELQQLEVDMEKEQGAVPGGWPGVYGCDYKNLTRVMVHMAKARVAFARKNFTTAEVRYLLSGLPPQV